MFHFTFCSANQSCCVKRKLMLSMTCKILQCLQDNEARLQDIDYADDADACDVKTLVYQRRQTSDAMNDGIVEYDVTVDPESDRIDQSKHTEVIVI